VQKQSCGTSKRTGDLNLAVKKPTGLIFVFERLAGSSVTKSKLIE
jgi:hypothetical protein